MSTDDYPTQGVCLIVPPTYEQRLTGWLATVQFERGHKRYSVKWMPGEAICQRDGKPVAWERLPRSVRHLINQTALTVRASKGDNA